MEPVPLQVAELTGRYERMLRRYTYGADDACSGDRYGHDAHAVIGEVAEGENDRSHGDKWPHEDERWPTACTRCGYLFEVWDKWQLNDNLICRMPNGVEFTFWGSFGQSAPAGAMLRIPWYDQHAKTPSESWIISLPDGGDWITTQGATGGGCWDVTGTPPCITATPSIWHNQPHGWHGWVRDGMLVTA